MNDTAEDLQGHQPCRSSYLLFGIPISERDLLELLSQTVYNIADQRAVLGCILLFLHHFLIYETKGKEKHEKTSFK